MCVIRFEDCSGDISDKLIWVWSKYTIINHNTKCTGLEWEVLYCWWNIFSRYRNFPVVSEQVVDLTSPRKYLCNFLGTVYPNSSREILMNVLRSSHLAQRCYIQERLEYDLLLCNFTQVHRNWCIYTKAIFIHFFYRDCCNCWNIFSWANCWCLASELYFNSVRDYEWSLFMFSYSIN